MSRDRPAAPSGRRAAACVAPPCCRSHAATSRPPYAPPRVTGRAVCTEISRRRRNFSHVRPLEDPVTATTAPIHRLLVALLTGLAALAAVVLLAPAAAHAATASAGVVQRPADCEGKCGGLPPPTTFIRFAASPGEANDVTWRGEGAAAAVIHDAGAPVVAGANCTALDEHTVRCALVTPPVPPRATVDLGDGGDRFGLGPGDGAPEVHGDDGDDVLRGADGAQPANLDGGAGADIVSDGPGASSLAGGPGPDTVTAGPGDDRIADGDGDADDLDGGDGADTVAYTAGPATAGAVVDLGAGIGGLTGAP